MLGSEECSVGSAWASNLTGIRGIVSRDVGEKIRALRFRW